MSDELVLEYLTAIVVHPLRIGGIHFSVPEEVVGLDVRPAALCQVLHAPTGILDRQVQVYHEIIIDGLLHFVENG